MKNRITLVMTIAVLAGFAVILLMNVAALFGIVPARYISPNDVRGIAVEHHNQLFTLNFKQQNALIKAFNHLIPITYEELKTREPIQPDSLEIKKIIIYRFNAPDIEITPVAFINKSNSVTSTDPYDTLSLVFSIPSWNSKGLLEESVNDSLYKTLSATYDR